MIGAFLYSEFDAGIKWAGCRLSSPRRSSV
jgi:hypothetical protein